MATATFHNCACVCTTEALLYTDQIWKFPSNQHRCSCFVSLQSAILMKSASCIKVIFSGFIFIYILYVKRFLDKTMHVHTLGWKLTCMHHHAYLDKLQLLIAELVHLLEFLVLFIIVIQCIQCVEFRLYSNINNH